MTSALQLSQQKFGRLTALKPGETKIFKSGRKVLTWLCVCDCGKQTTVNTLNLTNGTTKSCGCLRSDLAKKRQSRLTHGMTNSGTWKCWTAMKQRCLDTNGKRFKDYGGRGISIEPCFIASFQDFYDYMGDRPEGCSVGRIDNQKGYFKGNLRWETPKEQSSNTRRTQRATINGETNLVMVWCEKFGINYGTVTSRIYRGMTAEEALTTPINETMRKT